MKFHCHGAVLGATFAALFPERVERMVLDGVLDAEDYYLGKWSANLVNPDAASFFTSCYLAGADECPFYDSSPERIAERLERILDNLKATFPKSATGVYYTDDTTYSDAKNTMLDSLYHPIDGFPQLAKFLARFEASNATTRKESLRLHVYSRSIQTFTVADLDLDNIISCIDGSWRSHTMDSLDSFQEYTEHLMNQSAWVGDTWGSNVYSCKGLDVEPPVRGKLPNPLPSTNQTNFSILFIGNTIDPVTPISGAYKMSSAFPGSVVLNTKCNRTYVGRSAVELHDQTHSWVLEWCYSTG